MRIVFVCMLCVLICIPLLSSGEKLYLRDGSILIGSIESLDADSIYIMTSFGSKLALARKNIFKIEFTDSIVLDSGSGISTPVPAEPGSLSVFFNSANLSSKIVVHRDRELALSRNANTIEQLLYIDDELVFAYADTVTDKEIRKGADTILKNTITLKDIVIALPAGPHSLRLVIGSKGRNDHRDRFETEPLLESLDRSNLIIFPGKTTKIVIEAKKKKWGMGGTELIISE